MKRTVEVREKREEFVPGWWSRVKADGTEFDCGNLAIPLDGPTPDTWGVVISASGVIVQNSVRDNDSGIRIKWGDRMKATVNATAIRHTDGKP
jgi:hypothetical protein